jgi:hypothetical protein
MEHDSYLSHLHCPQSYSRFSLHNFLRKKKEGDFFARIVSFIISEFAVNMAVCINDVESPGFTFKMLVKIENFG